MEGHTTPVLQKRRSDPGSSYVILKQMGHLAGGVLAGEQQSQIYFLLTLTSAASVAGGMDLESGQCLLGDSHILR